MGNNNSISHTTQGNGALLHKCLIVLLFFSKKSFIFLVRFLARHHTSLCLKFYLKNYMCSSGKSFKK